jgi:hypothetical protein
VNERYLLLRVCSEMLQETGGIVVGMCWCSEGCGRLQIMSGKSVGCRR